MKKREPQKRTARSEYIAEDTEIEMLYAAAEAHPNWEVIPEGVGIRHIGSAGPETPRKLLEWFLKKGRH
jgi:hypothetical protein